jgi:hypothetical protein
MAALTHFGESAVMNTHVQLTQQESRRQERRYVFRRRGLMTTGRMTTPIHTLDVFAHGMGVMSAVPIKTGESCSVVLDALLGARVVQLKFSCTAVCCTLAGTEGFRTSLYIDGRVEAHQQQLQKIIATCSTLAVRDLG